MYLQVILSAAGKALLTDEPDLSRDAVALIQDLPGNHV